MCRREPAFCPGMARVAPLLAHWLDHRKPAKDSNRRWEFSPQVSFGFFRLAGLEPVLIHGLAYFDHAAFLQSLSGARFIRLLGSLLWKRRQPREHALGMHLRWF